MPVRAALCGRSVLTVREAAKALGVTTRTVYRMIERGELDPAPIKPHRGMAVTIESVDKWVKQAS